MAITGPGAAVQLVDGTGSPLGVTGNLLQVTGSGNATIYRKIGGAAATINASGIKGSAGQVYAYAFSNAQTTTCYARIYNAATSTVGSGTPVWGPIAVPAGSTVTQTFDFGFVCGTGISATMTGGAVDTDTTTLTLAGNAISIAYQ